MELLRNQEGVETHVLGLELQGHDLISPRPTPKHDQSFVIYLLRQGPSGPWIRGSPGSQLLDPGVSFQGPHVYTPRDPGSPAMGAMRAVSNVNCPVSVSTRISLRMV